MIFFLLLSAIFIIPFITAIALEPIIPYFTSDPRLSKEILTNIILCLIVAYGVYTGNTKPIKNKWILCAAFFPLMTIQLLPPIVIPYGASGQYNIGNIWIWRPIAQGLLYLMALQTLSFLLQPARMKKAVLISIYYAGLIMSFYVLCQSLGMDQFLITKREELIGHLHIANDITGTLGHSSLVAALIAISFIIGLHYRRWKSLLVMGLALIIAASDLAIAAIFVSLTLCYLYFLRGTRIRKLLNLMGILICIFLSGVLLARHHNELYKKIVNDNGRLNHWFQILDAWDAPFMVQNIPEGISPELKEFIQRNNKRTYQITGLGADAYKYLFSSKIKVDNQHYEEAHNELIEIGLFNHGLIGFVLYLGLFWSIKKRYHDKERQIALSVILALFLISLGTFIFHVEPFRFYVVLMAAILLSEK